MMDKEIIALVRANPMISSVEIIERLGLPKNNGYRMLHRLAATGEIHMTELDPQHRGWEAKGVWPAIERTLHKVRSINSLFEAVS